jgi:chemotaxis methyl-accepting protein methylase
LLPLTQRIQKRIRPTNLSNADQLVNNFSAAAKLALIEIAAATTSAATVAFSNRDAFQVR